MTTILLDGLNEETFRRSIESRLRQGLAAEAVEKLRGLLEPYAGAGRILPERFLTIQVSDLTLSGWDRLGEAIARHDRPGGLVTAISVAFGWPGDELPTPDPDGCLRPLIEVGFFTDEAFPFSQSAREDLLDGYSYHGCTWANDNAATETFLSLEGIDDLHGALAALEARLLASDEPDPDEICAGSLGACMLSALLYRAVSEQTQRDGLPRPMCVLAGSNGVYPYFDAPVAGIPDEILKAGEPDDEVLSQVPGPRYSSLLVTGIPRARKRAVLVLDESEEDKALRTADLRNLAQSDEIAEANPAPATGEPDMPSAAITPLPNGPLMVKKKPSEAWDFRDMLGPREAVMPTNAPEALPPPPVDEAPLLQAAEMPRPPVPPFPASLLAERPAEPGFALLEPTIQERLQSLIAPALVVENSQGTPIEPGQVEPEALAEPEVLPPQVGPVWPLGIGYLEDAEAAQELADDWSGTAKVGLWIRLRGWLRFGG